MNAKELLAQMRQKKQYEAAMASDARQTEELMSGADPTIGMSTSEKLAAGYQSGLRNVVRNVSNIAGLTSDERLSEADKLDAPLGETGAGSAGQFAGEMAALAPLSVPAGAAATTAKVASKAPKLSKALTAALPRASGAALPGAATALTEGAVSGAILAEPGERLDGAKNAAITGLALNKTLGALARKFGKGFDESDAAKAFGNIVEDNTGKRPSIPVAQSAKSDIVKYPHKSVLSMFPVARGGSKKMAEQTHTDWVDAVLRSSYSKDKGAAVSKVYKETGDLVAAVKKGKELSKGSPYLSHNREVLEGLAKKMKSKEPLTPKMLDSEVLKRQPNAGEARSFYELSSLGAEVLGEAVEESTVAGRRLFNKTMNRVADNGKTAAGALLVGPANYAALVGATRGATAKPVQNFMMGRTTANRGITNSVESIYADALRNATAAQEY